MKIILAVLLLGVFALASGASVLDGPKKSFGLFHQNDLNSCQGRCGQSGVQPNATCQCNTACVRFGDCCSDYQTLCLGSCALRCGDRNDNSQPCQCNTACERYGDCCPDYNEECQTQGGVTDHELLALGETFWSLEDTNNVASLLSWDLQGQTDSGSTEDLAPRPLLTTNPQAYLRRTIALLLTLHDNYYANVSIPEESTLEQVREENAFIDVILDTPVMQQMQAFLLSKGVPFSRDIFREMWFGLYSRFGNVLGSSGFEHVILGELTTSTVGGLHNWAFFAKEEEAGRINYRGWIDYIDLGSKGAIITNSFSWQGQNKPIGGMFVGTSPEFELAVYTACFLTRPDTNPCPMSFNGVRVDIITWTRDDRFVASAYPAAR